MATTTLETDNMRALVLKLALPSMVAQFVSVLYSIVDRMYIGNIPVVGAQALAGVGICGPIVTMISAFSFLIGIGGGPLVSIRLGQKRERDAERILSNCFVLLIGVGLAVMAVVYLLKEELLRWFGASDAIFPYADAYFSIYVAGTLFALLATGMNQFIICQGYSRTAMISVLLGAVCNIILDPVFIFGFGMGVAGAATATVLSQLFSCLFVLRFLFSDRPALRIRRIRRLDFKIAKNVCALGLSPFLIIAFDNVMLIALNAVITRYGAGGQGDMLLTCNTILQSFMLMITMPLGGITSGTQTILGYNFGARRRDRILSAQKWILVIALSFTLLMFAIAQTASQYFIMIFTRDAALVAETRSLIRIYTLAVPFLTLNYVIVDGFTGMGLYKYALPLSTWRKLVYFAGVFLLPALFGIRAVFWAEVFSDLLGPLASVLVYLTLGRRMLRRL